MSIVTENIFGIMGDMDFSSSKDIYAYQCCFCNKQYVGKTSLSLRIGANGHRLAIQRKHLRSSLFTLIPLITIVHLSMITF